VFEFLLGLRDDRVQDALAARGFGARERQLGWDLLKAVGLTQAVAVVTAKIEHGRGGTECLAARMDSDCSSQP
jgi:hypothetical protein